MNASVSLLSFDIKGDNRGSLISLENSHNIPFDIKRVYYIFGTKEDAVRGMHAHRKLSQVLVVLHGSVDIYCEWNGNKEVFCLNKTTQGLFISGLVWRKMMNFSHNSVLMVLADEYYDESDYIRSYSEFLKTSVMIHKLADVHSNNIGEYSRIWQFSVILDGAIIGKNCNICSHCFIENDVMIGNNVTIKCGVQIWDGITIGNNVFIGPNVTFCNDRYPISGNKNWKREGIRIEDGVSIGANSTILPGLVKGKGEIIGAGSKVTKSIAPNSVIKGVY